VRCRRPVDEDSSVPLVACHVLHAKTLRVARHAWCCIARCSPEGERRDSTPRLPRTLTLKALICEIDSALTACCEGGGNCGGRGLVAHRGHEQSQGVRTVAIRSCELQQSPEPAERGKQRHDGNTHALSAAGRGCVSKATCHSHGACRRRCLLLTTAVSDRLRVAAPRVAHAASPAGHARPHLMLCVASHAETWRVAYSRASAIPTGHRWASPCRARRGSLKTQHTLSSYRNGAAQGSEQ
jgi:hypothetical protein